MIEDRATALDKNLYFRTLSLFSVDPQERASFPIPRLKSLPLAFAILSKSSSLIDLYCEQAFKKEYAKHFFPKNLVYRPP